MSSIDWQTYLDTFGIEVEGYDDERVVPPEGPTDTPMVFVGEAPGETEVNHQRPFVGRAGGVLDRALDLYDIDRSEVFITNLVKERPPDNRDPNQTEIARWWPALKKEIKHIDPKVIAPLGSFPTREVLDIQSGVTKVHGQVFERDEAKVIPVFHPAATLYDGSRKDDFFKDIETVAEHSDV